MHSNRNIREGLDGVVAIWVALFATMVLVRGMKVLYRLGNEQQVQQLFEKLEEINPDYGSLAELRKYVAE